MNTTNLINLLRAARPFVEEAGTISGYGFYRPENPHDFHPDPESCSEEEIANHKAACEAWDRGDYRAEPGSESFHNEKGELMLHILRAPWGIGSYTDMSDEVADLLAAIDCALSSQVGWQPIETAPKVANTKALLAYADGTVLEGFYLDNSESRIPWAGWRPYSMVVWPKSQPTHWQPIPAPPTSVEPPCVKEK